MGHLQLMASENPLSIFCSDDVQQKELYIYQSIFVDAPSNIKVRNLQNGKIQNQSLFLTISAEASRIVIWPRPNGHGGSPVIFSASQLNGVLIGNGFGLKDARCFYLGQ